MVYTYTPTYYSSLHDSITSLCKTILPFSFKKRRLPATDQKLSKQQSDNLKWQQDSFHQILNLMGLCREGIVAESEVSAFRTQLLDALIASPADQEQSVVLRDKLLFLQELFYAKCISDEEYHSSKRPLLQRLAVQGVEIEARDVIVARQKENSEEEWSVIDLGDEDCLLNRENHSHQKNRPKHSSTMKQIRGAGASVLGLVSPYKNRKGKEGSHASEPTAKQVGANSQPSSSPFHAKNEIGLFRENPFWDSNLRGKESETPSILMQESLPQPKNGSGDRVKKKPPRSLFQREHGDGHGTAENCHDPEERAAKSAKKQWRLDGLKKWRRNNWDDETAPLNLSERSENEALPGSCRLVESPIGEGPDTKEIKRKLHPDGSASDFFIDKVLGDKIKKELSRIQSELCSKNPNLQFSNDQIDAISTKLPVDKGDLKKFFPKSWCDRYGDVVLDVVRKEFKDHVGEMESMRNAAREKRGNPARWTAFDNDNENCNPNLFAQQDHHPFGSNGGRKYFGTNPFARDYAAGGDAEKPRSESEFINPFSTVSRHGSSMLS